MLEKREGSRLFDTALVDLIQDPEHAGSLMAAWVSRRCPQKRYRAIRGAVGYGCWAGYEAGPSDAKDYYGLPKCGARLVTPTIPADGVRHPAERRAPRVALAQPVSPPSASGRHHNARHETTYLRNFLALPAFSWIDVDQVRTRFYGGNNGCN